MSGVRGDHMPVDTNDEGTPATPIHEIEDGENGAQFDEGADVARIQNPIGTNEVGATDFHVKRPIVQDTDALVNAQRAKG